MNLFQKLNIFKRLDVLETSVGYAVSVFGLPVLGAGIELKLYELTKQTKEIQEKVTKLEQQLKKTTKTNKGTMAKKVRSKVSNRGRKQTVTNRQGHQP